MLLRRASFVLFGLSLSIIARTYLANGQVCPSFPVDELGSSSELSPDGLVAQAIRPSSEETDSPINVRIVEYHFVCDASGMRRNTSRYISVLVKLVCTTDIGDSTLDQCDGVTNITRQAQFRCIVQNGESVWSATTDVGTSEFLQTLNPNATFTTPTDTRCRRCVDERSRGGETADPITHCEPCQAMTGCNQGQMRCYIGTMSDECCNFYDNDTCVAECPSPFVGDSETYDCGCGELSLGNGYVNYTNRFVVGSVATHICSSGYHLLPQDEATRTCTENGWSGQNVTCQCVECPDLSDIKNGKVIATSRCVNSTAEYTCDNEYKVEKGDVKRTCQSDGTWSGTEPQCNRGGLSAGAIAGIAVAVLAAGLVAVAVMTVVVIVVIVKKKQLLANEKSSLK